tara:strand:+ start:85942 stop:86724 length:783 start_codon:yes stop_codon:yes gene_type:complete
MANPLFIVGTGRCGTRFLHDVLKLEQKVAVHHERYPLMEAFQRYCRWYELDVDSLGFLAAMDKGIEVDLSRNDFSVESSAYLSFDVDLLQERYGAKILLMVRSPEAVINSYVNKGWYDRPYIQEDGAKALGYQGYEAGHHNFSRIAPRGDEFVSWSNLGRVGKLAWMWANFNKKVLDLTGQLPAESVQVVRLEDLDFLKYKSICEWAGVPCSISERAFTKLSKSKPNKIPSKFDSNTWSDLDWTDYRHYVSSLASELGYN